MSEHYLHSALTFGSSLNTKTETACCQITLWLWNEIKSEVLGRIMWHNLLPLYWQKTTKPTTKFTFRLKSTSKRTENSQDSYKRHSCNDENKTMLKRTFVSPYYLKLIWKNIHIFASLFYKWWQRKQNIVIFLNQRSIIKGSLLPKTRNNLKTQVKVSHTQPV